ncbi:MAG: pilus assembly protein TadG-related protein [Actinomycetota bacterium]
MRIKQRLASEDGGVLMIAAITLPILLLVSAGGVGGFSLFASHRELQRVADQAALAGAASLPPFDPNALVENAPFPLPDTEPAYERVEGATSQNLPRMRDLVPDPRAVACMLGTDALNAEGTPLVDAFDEDLIDPPIDEDGNAVDTVCDDIRIHPRIQHNPDSTTPVECTNRLIEAVADDTTGLQTLINAIVRLPVDDVLPAAFTPRMRVTTYSKIKPPLLSMITGSDGGTMRVSATAYRRIKNAVVVPILPAQRLSIDLGLVDPIDVMTNPTNLNNALNTAQKPLIDVITDADNRLSTLMSTLGLPCQHMLRNLRTDLYDLYNPPTGEAPSARDIVDAAVTAAEQTAADIGVPTPNPSDPSSLAGETFLLIGVTTTDLMGPVAATQIPILDVALVSMRRGEDGNFVASVVEAANAHGAFRATLAE